MPETEVQEGVGVPVPVTLERRLKEKFDVVNLLGIAGFHAAALFAVFPYFFSLSGVVIAIILWVITGMGICICYHRLLTHGSFKTTKFIEYFLSICGMLAMEGPTIKWVGVHRKHHQHADKDEDPHSPLGGTWLHVFWGHFIWAIKNDVFKRDYTQYAKDLQRDKFHVIMYKCHWLPQLILVFALFFSGMWYEDFRLGCSWVVWGIGVRTVFTYHMTWLVNSASHLWGYRNYETPDNSRNNWIVALGTFGEGWHNNHHHEQRSAAHGTRHWWEIDIAYYIICTLEACGLAWNVVRPKPVEHDAVKNNS